MGKRLRLSVAHSAAGRCGWRWGRHPHLGRSGAESIPQSICFFQQSVDKTRLWVSAWANSREDRPRGRTMGASLQATERRAQRDMNCSRVVAFGAGPDPGPPGPRPAPAPRPATACRSPRRAPPPGWPGPPRPRRPGPPRPEIRGIRAPPSASRARKPGLPPVHEDAGDGKPGVGLHPLVRIPVRAGPGSGPGARPGRTCRPRCRPPARSPGPGRWASAPASARPGPARAARPGSPARATSPTMASASAPASKQARASARVSPPMATGATPRAPRAAAPARRPSSPTGAAWPGLLAVARKGPTPAWSQARVGGLPFGRVVGGGAQVDAGQARAAPWPRAAGRSPWPRCRPQGVSPSAAASSARSARSLTQMAGQPPCSAASSRALRSSRHWSRTSRGLPRNCTSGYPASAQAAHLGRPGAASSAASVMG